jgi:hypothetical protein
MIRRNILKIAICFVIFSAGFLIARWTEKKHEPLEPPRSKAPAGFWFIRKPSNVDREQLSQEEKDRLASLGYVDGVKNPTNHTGVTVRNESLMQPGLNLYTSGHAPEAILMESSGEVRHRWKLRFAQAFPERPQQDRDAQGAHFWRYAHLFENGDLLAIYDGVGMVKVDKNSKLLWKYSGHSHHHAEVQPDGKTYVLTREARTLNGFNDGKPILEDFITILDSNGKEQRKISLLKALKNSIYSSALTNVKVMPNADVFHTNTVQVMDGSLESRMPFLKKGNILVSLCFVGLIAVVDPQVEKVIWAISHLFAKQHSPTFLQNGDMLVFDNQGLGQKSRVLQVNPLTQKVGWMYAAPSFFTEVLGSSFRLSNGNTLITDSDDGRAFEVTPDNKVVWEFFNPHRAGKNREFVAVIPEMFRLPENFNVSWLNQ